MSDSNGLTLKEAPLNSLDIFDNSVVIAIPEAELPLGVIFSALRDMLCFIECIDKTLNVRDDTYTRHGVNNSKQSICSSTNIDYNTIQTRLKSAMFYNEKRLNIVGKKTINMQTMNIPYNRKPYRLYAADAMHWILSENSDMFSFIWCCNVVSHDYSDAIQETIRTWVNNINLSYILLRV